MRVALCSVPAFLVMFGLMFLWVGVGRLRGMRSEAKPREALVWGTVGVVIGLLCLAAAAVVILWEPEDPRLGAASPAL